MTNQDFARSYWTNAQQILKEAESLFQNKAWHLVVRRSQECVELLLKALLREAGIEVPKVHDVGSLLLNHSDRFPNLPIERLVAISRRLRQERETSFYGDELTQTPPDKLYDQQDAIQALQDARFAYSTLKDSA
jgi:HEPN domain-containing protein